MDRFDAMAVFVAVVEAGSLSAASRQLGMPLATVSRKVGELESHLKTRLLIRTTRQLSLTDAGETYLAACRRILGDVGEAERVASGEYAEPKGELVVTAPLVFGRLHGVPVLSAFLIAHPKIDVRLVLLDRMAHLTEEHVDAAIRIGTLPDSSLVALRVGAIRRSVYASPAYLAVHGTPRTPQDLMLHHCVTFDGLGTARSWKFGSGRDEITVPVHSRLVLNTAEAAIDAASLGLGVTRALSYQAAEAVAQGRLVRLLPEYELPPWPVSVVHAGQPPLPRKLRVFLDFCAPALRERLAALPSE